VFKKERRIEIFPTSPEFPERGLRRRVSLQSVGGESKKKSHLKKERHRWVKVSWTTRKWGVVAKRRAFTGSEEKRIIRGGGICQKDTLS